MDLAGEDFPKVYFEGRSLNFDGTTLQIRS
jgi:hypothetical protein